MKELLFGAAYYDEYMPVSRVEEDMRLMKEAGMNVIRIAESTWSTWEPQEGVFDFTCLHRMLEGARKYGISVIVGTPTYAIPPWMAKKHPDILAETHNGHNRYGGRQNMDITNPDYRFYCERIIRRLMMQVRDYDNVIGFQLDNETKHYDTCSPRAQALFKAHLQRKFGTVEELNRAFGFAYWSNSIGSWDDLPDVRGTINGSFAAEYEAFQRQLVTDFLKWQRGIVDEYRHPNQFVTHNFDYEWRGYSHGLQPDVDQFAAAEAVSVVGCDIYHLTGEQLTGAEISFGGDLARGLKNQNFLVLETQAQGPVGRLPYPGQLRLQAYAHLANGANMVEYWHWHSIHNGLESHWKGVLSHDLTPGATYREAAQIGKEFARLSSRLVNRKRISTAAVVVSNRSLTGIKHSASFGCPEYGDILRWVYDSLYRLNISCDIVSDTQRDFAAYDLVVTPGLYCAEEGLMTALRNYVAEGGHLISTFRSFFCDENLKIRTDCQPAKMTEVFGMSYDEFTVTKDYSWTELLRPETAEVLCSYDIPAYSSYAAATFNSFGRGSAAYLGATLPNLDQLMEEILVRMGIEVPALRWPLIVKKANGLRYYMNYSDRPRRIKVKGYELLSEANVDAVKLEPWGVAIVKESD